MEVPTTLDELLEFAKKCVTEDPDGNGVDDTYFMLAAGGGSGFGMLEGFGTAFGNSAYSVGEDGKLYVAVHVEVYYGYVLPELASALRCAIAESLATQAGVEVSAVDVFVDGIQFKS